MTEIILLGSATLFLATTLRLKRYLHIFQLEEYLPARFWKWLRERYRIERVEALLAISTILAGAYAVSLPQESQDFIAALAATCWAIFYVPVIRRVREVESKSKKPLVFTARAVRMFVATVLLFAFGSIAAGLFTQYALRNTYSILGIAFVLPALWLITQAVPLFILAANAFLFPLEEILRQRFLFQARRKINSMPNLQVVGITGSYGKTSTKEILASILSTKYRVAKTPHSFNTLMGVCKVVNDDLRSEHEIFIVEMGAYRRGEIRAICNLVKPRIGVITAIGPQHLQRFGTLDAIAAAKYELIETLPADGVAVFNADDENCARLAEKTSQRVVRYGMCDGATLRAKNISSSARGVEFELVASVIASLEGAKQSPLGKQIASSHPSTSLRSAQDAPRNDTIEVHTALLGRHNISNILAAAAMALELGTSLEEIVAAIAKLEPVPHRLQLLPGANGVNVIDDAYNSNPIGAFNALDVLSDFGGKRILITPGIVELGDEAELQNKRLGEKAATICDYVFIVGNGKLTKAIEAGLIESKFPNDRYRVFNTLDNAVTHLGMVLSPGDTVLFENDLPDHY